MNIQAMSSLLSDSAHADCSHMRLHITELYKSLSGLFACLMPIALYKFMCGYSGIASGGLIQFEDSPGHVGKGFNQGVCYKAAGSNWIYQPPVLQMISRKKTKGDHATISFMMKCINKKRTVSPEEDKHGWFANEKGNLEKLESATDIKRKTKALKYYTQGNSDDDSDDDASNKDVITVKINTSAETRRKLIHDMFNLEGRSTHTYVYTYTHNTQLTLHVGHEILYVKRV